MIIRLKGEFLTGVTFLSLVVTACGGGGTDSTPATILAETTSTSVAIVETTTTLTESTTTALETTTTSNSVTTTTVVEVIMPSSGETYPPSDTGQTQSYTEVWGEDSDYTILPSSYVDKGDGTVSDTVTALIWQQQDDGIQRGWGEAEVYCSELLLAGYADWRLPDITELISIADYGAENPVIDQLVFPTDGSVFRYSSATPNPINRNQAWSADFTRGITTLDDKGTFGRVRCVRGEEIPPASLVDSGNGTVTDYTTGLLWQQQGMDELSWEEAISYCEELVLAGAGDWRLPNIKELQTIVDTSVLYPAVSRRYFPGIRSSFYWSSTSDWFTESIPLCNSSCAGGDPFSDGPYYGDNYVVEKYALSVWIEEGAVVSSAIGIGIDHAALCVRNGQ
ncbi:MAG: DUF1566 domain-containing protein [Proteobacteria bacterium]|nr:DUF1566 domain-containing protein [Pseudomonadota bacterium]MBU1688386.1 DUF1566 domain-containing protein [Pseudomonadota bacterium]